MFDKDLFLSLCEKYDVEFNETAKEPITIICENNNKLVQHIKIDMLDIPKQGMYCYGEASFEANQAMQEPLEKLYKYKNKPDMREKVNEYISELDAEINRCHKLAEQNMDDEATTVAEMMVVRVQVLTEVKNDLESILDEII